MKVLFIGDVYMEKGMESLKKYLPQIKRDYKPNLIICNAENIAKGNGLTKDIYKQLMGMGIHAVTLGNHTFSKREIVEFFDLPNIARPANYGNYDKGNKYITINYNSKKVTIINLLGRVFMRDLVECPFKTMDDLLKNIKSDYIIVDFHAEATSEKYALANYLDGRVNALVGTHTHVPTADNITFPKGMMYISDIGMTGVKYGIIGGEIAQGINKFLTGIPEAVRPQMTGPLQFNAVLMDFNLNKIEKINIFE